ncbi:hypothetical protein [Luteimonas sp. SDU101]|uniref:hypothetical protein n=1 Tax=Luteimonas sp. SDU101 TaxID=3422593 RepID=UPI003EB80C9B
MALQFELPGCERVRYIAAARHHPVRRAGPDREAGRAGRGSKFSAAKAMDLLLWWLGSRSPKFLAAETSTQHNQ